MERKKINAKSFSVASRPDFVRMEKELLRRWYKNKIVGKYLARNKKSKKIFSFLDGPITANNPMGVHHAWGRTYKDVWQRWYNMRGFRQRFQNGFDEQGLWVEVEVEKELGLKSKKDIENLVPGDKFASLEKFVNLCKARVKKYSRIQTEQSKRLGYFMDWEHSYHTSSDENNYMIWRFLKTVYKKGWLYKGRDSVPWCPRCGTAISQHEILTEEYKEITHTAVYVKFPLVSKGWKDTAVIVWTTTPWTLPANVAAAVDEDLTYEVWSNSSQKIILGERQTNQQLLGKGWKKVKSIKGQDLVGLEYEGPFDSLEAVKVSLDGFKHKIIATNSRILPISTQEGTGIVHIAPGAGTEDFALAKEKGLPTIAPITESAHYKKGFGWLTGKYVGDATPQIVDWLKKKGLLLKDELYTHRYPTCWRCKTELVWRIVDEWYIAMDKKDKTGKTYREQMIEVAKTINWLPDWGLERELDWLRNMHDWLISKKRYWGLSLPIWECKKCGKFEVIGSKEELKQRAVQGWSKFEGHSPHRPWIDEIKIKCKRCGRLVSRIPDVGNPWLDAGIVPFSTITENNQGKPLFVKDKKKWRQWFPADFITESFPGQFKNWFYALIAMSTVLAKERPFKNVLGFASVRDEKGEEMHKSKGNAIEFNEAADKVGVDVMRWLYVRQNPEHNLNFGYKVLEEIRRRFYLILWNCYKFFMDYGGGKYKKVKIDKLPLSVLDRWILSRLEQTLLEVENGMSQYDAAGPTAALEDFVLDLSTWYIRRSRERVSPVAAKKDKEMFLKILWYVLERTTRALAPFLPFVTDEIYQHLTDFPSVHLTDYPVAQKKLIDKNLMEQMALVRQIVSEGHSARKTAQIPVRQPLAKIQVVYLNKLLNEELIQLIKEELNVKDVVWKEKQGSDLKIKLDTHLTPELIEEGKTRELARRIQEQRKKLGVGFDESVLVVADWLPRSQKLKNWLKKKVLADKLELGTQLVVKKVS